MEFRKWEEYSDEDKTTILNHWFYYYGGLTVTFEEIRAFRGLVESRKEDIFDHILTNMLYASTIKTNLLVSCMRSNKLDELFNHSIKMDQIGEDLREKVEEARQILVNEMVRTLLFPEPPEPMDIHIIIEDNPKNGKGR